MIARLLVLVFLNSAFSVYAAEPGCSQVAGTIAGDIVRDENCRSPLHVCVRGALVGGIIGSYVFSMDNQRTDPTGVDMFSFTGNTILTIVTMDPGKTIQLFGDDTGSYRYSTDNISPFTSTYTIAGGTEGYENGAGFISISGASDFKNATTAGRYSGVVCVSKTAYSDYIFRSRTHD
jgi:hypothetical protein